jgi:four helix bundle protein
MAAKRFEELDAWKRSVELRDSIVELTESGKSARDFDFRDQIRDACRSAPRNIAEGFGRFNPKPFAFFMRIACGSLNETRNHLLDGQRNGYFAEADVKRLLELLNRALGASTGLLRYLDSCDGEAPTGWSVNDDESSSCEPDHEKTPNREP